MRSQNSVKWAAGSQKYIYLGNIFEKSLSDFPAWETQLPWRNLDLAFRAFVRQSKMHQRWDWVARDQDHISSPRSHPFQLHILKTPLIISIVFLWRLENDSNISHRSMISSPLFLSGSPGPFMPKQIALILLMISHQLFVESFTAVSL